jgi:nitrite reductase/ring-hydroxylating ferredoxin subunit
MAELMSSGRVAAKIFPHPLNAWYAVAWDHEVSARGVLSRTVAGKPMALYRTRDGRPVALADACWHRLAPLSMGKLVGDDEVQRPYHGLRFNSAGRCTAMPAQETVNPSQLLPRGPSDVHGGEERRQGDDRGHPLGRGARFEVKENRECRRLQGSVLMTHTTTGRSPTSALEGVEFISRPDAANKRGWLSSSAAWCRADDDQNG